MKLPDHSCSKLSDQDWEILENLEMVLFVSSPFDPSPKTVLIETTGPSQFSAHYVVRVKTYLVICHPRFRDVYDDMGNART